MSHWGVRGRLLAEFGSVVVLGIQGCLTQVVLDTEVRIQLENRSDVAICCLVSAPQGAAPLVWVADTLGPQERSAVRSTEIPGRFDLQLSVQDSLCGESLCWRQVAVGRWHLDGGSHYFRASLDSGPWQLLPGRAGSQPVNSVE